MYYPNTLYTIIFFATTVAEALINVSFEAYIFAQFRGVQNTSTAPDANTDIRALQIYLVIFAFAHIFQLVLAYDALAQKNTLQIIGLCIFNFMFLIYAVIQISEIQAVVTTYATPIQHQGVLVNILAIVIAIAEIIFCYSAYQLYKEFGWKIYKRIGADLVIRKMFLAYLVFICIIKFDFFFFMGFTMQFAGIVLSSTDIEFKLTIAVIPLTLLLLVIAVYAVRHENKWGMWIFNAGLVVGFAYFVFKLFRIYDPSKTSEFVHVKKSLTTFAVLSALLLLGTLANALVCQRNFGRGLKKHMNTKNGVMDEYSYDDSTFQLNISNGNKKRMTLD